MGLLLSRRANQPGRGRRPARGLAPLIALLVGAAAVFIAASTSERRPIRIGVLHSLSGTMAISERALVDAVLLAVEEINAEGGVLGRRVEPVIVDGASDPAVFAAGAERLIREDKVQAVFGCWTSGCRRTLRPIFERYDHLLFYPLQYEGVEASPNIVYVGAAPNQQIVPALRWALAEHGPRVFFVGSDYVFPRTAAEILRNALHEWRGTMVGEEYLPLGSADVDYIVDRIVESRPDVILNAINGDTNEFFFRALRARGIDPATIPTISFSVAEEELRQLGPELVAGDYAAWTYFQSMEEPINQEFIARFRERYGADRVTNDPIEAAYSAVHLWAGAAGRARSARPKAVLAAIGGLSIPAPSGMLYVEPTNRHVWKTTRIGQIRSDGQFDVVWSGRAPLRPDPFPGFRSEASWGEFMDSLYRDWGGWAAPGP